MAQLSGVDSGVYARESKRMQEAADRKEAARREKSCTSKNRYATKHDAEAAAFACADYGTKGLSVYQCPYCKGWHLTSHPWDD